MSDKHARAVAYTVGSESGRYTALEQLGGEAVDVLPRTASGVAVDLGVPFAPLVRGAYEIESGVALAGALGQAGSVAETGAVLAGAGAVGATSAIAGAGLAGVVGYVAEAARPTVEHIQQTHLREEHILAHHFAMQSYEHPTVRRGFRGYQYDQELSTDTTGIWHNLAQHKTFVAHRGTTTAEDVFVSDVHVLRGSEDLDARFEQALRTTELAHAKYNFEVEGGAHSLGGSILMHVTEKLGDKPWLGKQVTFNMGSLPFGKSSKPYDPPFAHKIVHIRQQNDLISMTPPAFGRTQVYNTTSDPLEAHKLTSFSYPPEKNEMAARHEQNPSDRMPTTTAPHHPDGLADRKPDGPVRVLGYVYYPAELATDYEGKAVAFR